MDGKCAVLVCSCDDYQDAWTPFFYFFYKHWSNCPYTIYFNTETKKCVVNGLKITTINTKTKNQTWSLRLKNALKSIEEEYVIILLEDFFFLDDVRQDEVDKCLCWMKSDRKISCFSFDKQLKSVGNPKYKGYGLQTNESFYWLNAQAGIWRKNHLIKYLSPYENAWQFEWFGTNRAKLYGNKFYALLYDEKSVFNYIFNLDTGYGIYRGKWLKSNIKLFEGNGLIVDFSKMGFYEKDNVDNSIKPPKKMLKEKLLFFVFGGCSKVKMSVFKQMSFFLKHPRQYLQYIKIKIKFVIFKEFWE